MPDAMTRPAAGLDLDAIRTGFSAMADAYDALDRSHPVIIWMRSRIRDIVEAHLPPGGSILEINCGSGLDAAYFAARGYRVHATDIAPGMLEAVAAKAQQPELEGRLTYESVSNLNLQIASGRPYDLVLSNLGGLNCVDDPGRVTRQLAGLLKPGGISVLVVMPPVCPWEMLQAFRGHFRTAMRRFRRGGVEANVGGSSVRTWYHTPGRLEEALGSDFETIGLRSFCTFAPPSYFEGFTRRHEGLVRRLMSLDDRLGATPLFRSTGDFYALVSRRR
jgi:SAM-dependent methyltransferase